MEGSCPGAKGTNLRGEGAAIVEGVGGQLGPLATHKARDSTPLTRNKRIFDNSIGNCIM